MTNFGAVTAAPPVGLTVGEVSRESGVAPSAVRFYERTGVIEAGRTGANYRVFNRSAACRIKVAKLAQEVGLTVQEIADRLTDEAERRVASLRRYLTAIATSDRLCEDTKTS